MPLPSQREIDLRPSGSHAGATYSASSIILATGSRPAAPLPGADLPGAELDDCLNRCTRLLTIVGAGVIGMELPPSLPAGRPMTVLEMQPQALTG